MVAAERTPTRRRLPRGWWPDQGKREGLKLKAMDDLKNETFVSNYFDLSIIIAVVIICNKSIFASLPLFANDIYI